MDKATPNDDVIDVKSLMDHVGSDLDLLSQLTELFVSNSSNQLNRIRTALDQGDLNTVYETAHQFKGAIGNFYAPDAHEIARELERAGREQRLDDARTLFLSLEKKVSRLLESLADLRPPLG